MQETAETFRTDSPSTHDGVLRSPAFRLGPDARAAGDVWLRQPLGHDAFQLQIAGGLKDIRAGNVQVLCQAYDGLVLVPPEQVQQLLLSNDKRVRSEILLAKEKEIEREEY